MSQTLQRTFTGNSEGLSASPIVPPVFSTPLLPQPVTNSGRLIVKTGSRITFFDHENVDWVEAQRDYVLFHMQTKKILVRGKISDFEKQLPPEKFYRIHRSTIVNVNRIREMQSLLYGEYAVILTDGTRLRLSRSFRERVFHRLTGAA